MIKNFLLILSLCGFVLGMMACSVLWFSNKTHKHANRLLALSLFGLTMTMLVTFLYEWDIRYYAYIYRFPSPLYYLIMPAAYLYIRAVINDEVKFKKWDFIHFLPALLRLMDMIPFYFTSYAYRRDLVEKLIIDPDNLIKFNEGLLPPYFHTAFMSILGLTYLVLMVVTIKKMVGIKRMRFIISHSRSFRWLQAFTSLIAFIAAPLIFMVVFDRSESINRMQLLLITICVCFFVINLYLFFQPEILYGIPRMVVSVDPDRHLKVQNDSDQENKLKQDTVEEELLSEENNEIHSALIYLERYKPALELYLATAKPFLKQSYSIIDLSRESGIPQHHLSALLNRIYKMRFNEFMNRMRIDYISENFGNAEWENLTLEGIAKQAGFNSRTTFFNSIKKTTGLAPSEFVENIKAKQ